MLKKSQMWVVPTYRTQRKARYMPYLKPHLGNICNHGFAWISRSIRIVPTETSGSGSSSSSSSCSSVSGPRLATEQGDKDAEMGRVTHHIKSANPTTGKMA